MREAVVLACVALAGCTVAARFARPEGDGGWSAERRGRELAERARAAAVPYPAAAAEARRALAGPLTLPAALALATSGNRRIVEAEKQLEAARARVWEARGRLLPATTGSGRYTRYTDPLTNQVAFPPGVLPAGVAPPVVVIREDEAAVFNGTVTVPLDLSGELTHTLASAQAGYRGERARLWATTLAQHVLVVQSYFELLEAERLRDVTRQTIDVQRQQLANAQSRFDSGRLTKNELLVVQVALRNAEQRLVQGELAIARARWTLNDTLGLPVDAPTAVVDVTDAPAVPRVDDALQDAYAHNPALAGLVEEQQRLEETTRALVRGRLPRVSGGGAIDYTTSDIVQPQDVGSGFVGFTWDLGTDTRREAAVAEARVAAERNRVGIERELRELERAVRLTQRALEERLTAFSTAEVAVVQAEENLRIRTQQFDAGRATSDDVLDADAILAAQRAVLASALYQAHTRRAELQQLIGLPLDLAAGDGE
jgi:outer membrane protein TolC